MITQGDVYRLMAEFADNPNKVESLLDEVELAKQTVGEWIEERKRSDVKIDEGIRSLDIVENIRLVMADFLAMMLRNLGIYQISPASIDTSNAIMYMLYLLAYKVEERTKREVLAELVFGAGGANEETE